jgi:ferredoxin
MKTAIYYFSGTGNSLALAKDLAKELGDAEIYPISKIMKAVQGSDKKFSPSAERIVIVTPVYVSGLPNIVADFAGRIRIGEGKKAYAIATYGGMAGKVLPMLDAILSKEGPGLSAGFLVKMPGNCITLYSAASKSKQDELFRIAKLKIKDIAKQIAEGADGKLEQTFSILNTLFPGQMHAKIMAKMKENDKDFYATEKCNSCGICVKVCPVGNIELKDGKPVWNHNCEQCMACIQWCPVEAIQHGSKTINRKRYRHPDIRTEELMNR